MKPWPLLVLLCGALAGPAARAQEPATRIGAIEIAQEGPGAVDAGFVRTHTAARVGAELDRALISRDVKALLATGRFSDVRARLEPARDGVKLVYVLKNKRRLAAPVRVTGNRHFGENKIREWLGLAEGDAVDETLLSARAQKVLAEYREDSFPRAALSWELAETDAARGLVEATARIAEGPRARLARIVFVGNRTLSDRELRAELRRPAWYNVFRWFSRNAYDRERVEEARTRIRARYLARGFLDAQVAEPQVEIDAAPVSAPQLAGLINRVADGTINIKTAKEVFAALWRREADSADAIIEARGLSSAASAANAAIDHMRDWALGSDGRWVTMGVPSDGAYGIPEDIVYGMPVVCSGGSYEVVKGLAIDEFSRAKMDATLKELLEERDGVKHLLG